jgi:hypothetical protein
MTWKHERTRAWGSGAREQWQGGRSTQQWGEKATAASTETEVGREVAMMGEGEGAGSHVLLHCLDVVSVVLLEAGVEE